MQLSNRHGVRWVVRVAILVASGALGYWLVFTTRWLFEYLPHGGPG